MGGGQVSIELAITVAVAIVQVIILPAVMWIVKTNHEAHAIIHQRVDSLDKRLRAIEANDASQATELRTIEKLATAIENAPTRREFDQLTGEVHALRDELRAYIAR